MGSRQEIHRTAHAVIDRLAATEPAHAGVEDLERWRKAVRNRIRSEHWASVVETITDAPDTDPEALADHIRAGITPKRAPEPPNPTSAIPHFRDLPGDPPTPEQKAHSLARIAQIRNQIAERRQQR